MEPRTITEKDARRLRVFKRTAWIGCAFATTSALPNSWTNAGYVESRRGQRHCRAGGTSDDKSHHPPFHQGALSQTKVARMDGSVVDALFTTARRPPMVDGLPIGLVSMELTERMRAQETASTDTSGLCACSSRVDAGRADRLHCTRDQSAAGGDRIDQPG